MSEEMRWVASSLDDWRNIAITLIMALRWPRKLLFPVLILHYERKLE